jgi:hypothetical protein
MLALRPDLTFWISSLAVATTIALPTHAAQMQFTQQGPKLVGSGYAATAPQQGTSVAISGDGNTIIVGGPGDIDPSTGAQVGAAWVFTRTNGTWSQEGNKLVGTGAPGDALQGTSVALSADGNTAIIGGPADNATTGAAWVFTQTNGVWSQQGAKLVATGAIGLASQGQSVSLSADGNTALVGGPTDNSNIGAAWIFTRSNGVWGQRSKLVGYNGSSSIRQGTAVALSGDASTAIIGSISALAGVFVSNGSVWTLQTNLSSCCNNAAVALSSNGNTALTAGDLAPQQAVAFTRSNGSWNSGVNLLATGGNGPGDSVSLSADGSAAIVGNTGDAGVWAFTNPGGGLGQFRSKLVGTGAVGTSQQGTSVSLSGDGSTFVVGGPADNSGVGAVWIFVLSPVMVTVAAHDFNGDGKGDLLWQNCNSFVVADWLMNGTQVLQSFGLGPVPSQWTIVGQRDFNGDGFIDLLWRDTAGDTSIWFLSAGQVGSAAGIGNIPSAWAVVGTGDFNGDRFGDILWQDPSGNLAVWLMNGAAVLSSAGLGNIPTVWSVVGIGDFNGDGDSDILWRDTSGNTAIWFMNGTTVASTAGVGNVATTWTVVGTGDFNGDGKSDIVWRDKVGDTAIWLMNGAAALSAGGLGNVPTTWSITLTGDYNGDGMSDLLWRDTAGNTAIWFMNGLTVLSSAGVGNIPGTWTVQSVNAE